MRFSVVIPTHNEGSQISSSLRRLREISKGDPVELLIVDGGSEDDTVEMARPWADHVLVLDKPNRGAQLDAGAKKAGGEFLFFLRADAQPPGNWQQALEHYWLTERPEKTAATIFSVDYGASLSFRLASALANASASLGGLPSGDHGYCTTPQIYSECGGFPPLAANEDLAFAQRLLKHGRIAVLPEKIWPAARRMHSAGALTCVLESCWEGLRFRLGAAE